MGTQDAYEQRIAGLGTRLRTVEAENTALRKDAETLAGATLRLYAYGQAMDTQRDALKEALNTLALAVVSAKLRGECTTNPRLLAEELRAAFTALALPDPETGA